jgi:hypothetical protein
VSLEKNQKTIYLYLILFGAIGAFFRLYPYYDARGRLITAFICAFIAYIAWLLLRPVPTLHPAFPLEFASHPEKFDHQLITIEGRVVKIFSDSIGEGLKRKIIDIYRTFIGSKNYEGRYSHLRFLIEAPKLRSRILVEHNLQYGKPHLHYGSIVELKGEYIHTDKPRAKFFYGKIHYTHEPKGYLKKL